MAMFKIVLPNKEIVEINCNGDTPNVGNYLEVDGAGYRVVDVHRRYVDDKQYVWVYVEDAN